MTGRHILPVAVAVLVALGGLTAAAAFRKAEETQHVSADALPLREWIILVDAGHGGYDGGARARDSGVWEKQINLQVALAVESALQAQGAEVIMTRREDVDLCTDDPSDKRTKKRQDMERRIALAQEAGADMVLSIHMNEYRQRSQAGPQVFYRKGADASRLLAGCMQQALIDHLRPARERSALAGDYFILQLEVPSVLIECGFISNPQEEKLLLDADYHQRLAAAITDGVLEYVRLSGRSTGATPQTPPAEEP